MKHHIIITGTGRAGTTFLVRLLTELGQDTGFDSANWKQAYHEHCEAGLETSLLASDAPYIVKSPALSVELANVLQTGTVAIDHAIIPIRPLDEASRSRVRNGGADNNVPGGLWMVSKPEDQKAALAESFHGLLVTLTANEIPFTMLEFPRFAKDVHYAWKRLYPLLKGVDELQFHQAFQMVSNPNLIHDYSASVPEQSLAAKRFLARRRRRKLLRWLTPTLAVTSLAGVLWLLPS